MSYYTNDTYAQGNGKAHNVQEILNNGEYNGHHVVIYDDCESCLTRFYYDSELYKVMRNTDFIKENDVSKFNAPAELKDPDLRRLGFWKGIGAYDITD